jgi:plastocyanin
MPRRLPPTFAAGLVALAVAACGSGSSSGTGAGTPSSGPPCADNCASIQAKNVQFKTKSVTAKAGTITIELQNQEPPVVAHNVTVKTPTGNKQVVQANGGKIVTGTIDLPAGTYTYICTIPGHESMQGTLTVK